MQSNGCELGSPVPTSTDTAWASFKWNTQDDQFSLVEKKYQDQIRLIENEFSREKELMLMQTCHLRQDIEKQMISVQEQIGKMRKNIIGLEEVSVHEIGDGSDVVNVVAYWLTKTPPPDNSFIVLY